MFLVSYFTAYYINEYNKYSSSKQVHSREGLLLVLVGAHRVDAHYNAGADRNAHTESQRHLASCAGHAEATVLDCSCCFCRQPQRWGNLYSTGMCAAGHLRETLLGEVVENWVGGLNCGSSVCMILLRIAVSIHPAQGAIQSLPPPMHLKYIYTQ